MRCLVCREPTGLLPVGPADVGGGDLAGSHYLCFYLVLRFDRPQEAVSGQRAQTPG